LSQTKSVWTTTGYRDFKNISRSVKLHESAKEHIRCMLKHLENNKVTIVDALNLNEHGSLFKKKYNENVRFNRLFMEHLIDIVLFLGRQELAFRGHDESSSSSNKGNFKELFEMYIIRCSLEIQNHYKSIKNIFSGLSNTIQNDLRTCVSDHILNCIKTEIKECMFYSVQVDDTTDISQRTQCSIILRYKDGASVMAGHVNGLQVKVKEVAPNALFTHCLAHRLNLVLQHGCSEFFFANMTGISSFFS